MLLVAPSEKGLWWTLEPISGFARNGVHADTAYRRTVKPALQITSADISQR